MDKFIEIEELNKKYKLKAGEVLVLQILAIVEGTDMTYNKLKKIIKSRQI